MIIPLKARTKKTGRFLQKQVKEKCNTQLTDKYWDFFCLMVTFSYNFLAAMSLFL